MLFQFLKFAHHLQINETVSLPGLGDRDELVSYLNLTSTFNFDQYVNVYKNIIANEESAEEKSCDGNVSEEEEIIEAGEKLSPPDALEHLQKVACYMQNETLLKNKIKMYVDKI